MTQPLTPREVFHQLVQGVAERRWDDVLRLYADSDQSYGVVHGLVHGKTAAGGATSTAHAYAARVRCRI
jgi:hypothetical protein